MSVRRRIDGVVPVTMKAVALELDHRHLRVRDIHAGRIAVPIDFRSYVQARSAVRRADQTDDRGQTHQRRAAPVHGNVGKDPVFDAIPPYGTPGSELRSMRPEFTDWGAGLGGFTSS